MGTGNFGLPQSWFDDANDTLGDAVLQIENVFQIAIEPVGPKMRAALGIDQLTGYANLATPAPDAAFQDVEHAQFTGHVTDVHGAALEGEGGVARDHEY